MKFISIKFFKQALFFGDVETLQNERSKLKSVHKPFKIFVAYKCDLCEKKKFIMQQRINIQEIDINAYKSMFALENYLENANLSKTHLELIKIRASQINGCAFCINMHTSFALSMGETAQRIFLLNAWRETSLFDEEEKVILAMTEEITLIHKNGLSEETYQQAEKYFDQNYIVQIIMAIVTINAWNRISVSTRKPVE